MYPRRELSWLVTFHVDNTKNTDSAAFNELLELFGLQNHVDFPSHSSGHTLDWILTEKDDSVVSCIRKHLHLPSDHVAVTCNLAIGRPDIVKKHLSWRNLKGIDMDSILQDLSSEISSNIPEDIDSLASFYEKSLRSVLDIHAPIKDRHITLRPMTPWYNKSLRQAKQQRRRCERRMMKSGLQVDREIFKAQCKEYYHFLAQAQKEYYQSKVDACDQRKLFEVVKELTSPSTECILPSTESDITLANSFASFFQQKIKKARDTLEQANF